MREIVDLEQMPEGFRGRAYGEGAELTGWILFYAPADVDLWVCAGQTGPQILPPKGISFPDGDGDLRRKLCALVGYEWESEELQDELVETAAWQQTFIRRMGPGFRRRVDNSTAEEIAEWRADIESMTPGELFMADMVGDEPGARRN